jgi:hypothetical protein
MLHTDTPWIGLVALFAMFLLPFLPSWLFEGPRTVKHRPRRHVCARCGAAWADGHTCAVGSTPRTELLHAELQRPIASTALERYPEHPLETDD